MKEVPLYSIQSLKTMEVIDINSGAKLGYIKDLKVDCENSKILSVIIPSTKISFFGKNNDMEISWEKVNKIGIDVILVDENNFTLEGK